MSTAGSRLCSAYTSLALQISCSCLKTDDAVWGRCVNLCTKRHPVSWPPQAQRGFCIRSHVRCLPFTQGDDPDITWTFQVINYWVKLGCGILGVIASILWILQVILYVMISPPVSGFLNDFFIMLGASAFGQIIAVILFGCFSLYLLLCTMAGSFKLGLNFVVFSVRLSVNATSALPFRAACE